MPPSGQPQPSSSSNLKYVLIGLAFLAGTIGLWFVARGKPTQDTVVSAPPPSVERVNPMAKPDLEMPQPEVPDAGSPEPVAPVVEKRAAAVKRGDEWDCSGDLAGAEATKVINDNRAQIRACYERRLKVNNILQGDIRLKVRVAASGKVTATSVAGSLHDEAVLACVRTLAQSWTFPVPTGGTCAVVQVPFHFSPKP